ncbi:MAG TPA: hypothetical protein VIK80_00580 [Flavihumibacter sp.]
MELLELPVQEANPRPVGGCKIRRRAVQRRYQGLEVKPPGSVEQFGGPVQVMKSLRNQRPIPLAAILVFEANPAELLIESRRKPRHIEKHQRQQRMKPAIFSVSTIFSKPAIVMTPTIFEMRKHQLRQPHGLITEILMDALPVARSFISLVKEKVQDIQQAVESRGFQSPFEVILIRLKKMQQFFMAMEGFLYRLFLHP